MFFVKLANFLAKYSCSKWNHYRVLRRVCRAGYRSMADITAILQRLKLIGPAVHFERSKLSKVPLASFDTYPYLYRNPDFAPWEEDDDPKNYTLITDPANFVIRRSTSYCAWKIYELTGRWPIVRSYNEINRKQYLEISLALEDIPPEERRPAEARFDAKYWREFLALNGYTKVVEAPISGHHYVGIQPDEGEFGQVVWVDSVNAEQILVSTYFDFEYRVYKYAGVQNTTWIEIC